MSSSLIAEIKRIAVFVLIAAAFGSLLGQVFTTIGFVVLLYIGWHIRQIYRLDRWFNSDDKSSIPDATGLWGDLFSHIYHLQKKNKQSKRKLAKLLSRFQQLTSAMPDATVVLNQNREIEWFNKAAKKLLGLRSRQDIGHRIDNLLRHPKFIKYLNSNDYEKPVELESPQNTELLISIRLVPYASNQMLLVCRNITRLYHLEKVRQDFVANVSHELRSPLTVINGYLETFTGGETQSLERMQNQIREYPVAAMQSMMQQSARMTRIVDDLLTLSRLENDDLELDDHAISIAALSKTLLQETQPLVEQKQQQLELDMDENLWLRGHEKDLLSAFSNLILNAIKYTEQGGQITVRWYSSEKGACFEVEDNGLGIANVHIDRLTERFYRVDKGRSRDQGGTGLGLAIVKHVLIRHQAELKIQSTPGLGSKFICRFPHTLVLEKDT